MLCPFSSWDWCDGVTLSVGDVGNVMLSHGVLVQCKMDDNA